MELFPGKYKVAHVELFNRFLSCTIPLVLRRGGLIVNYTTTGFMANFGFLAENDGGMERSAMRAAVDVVDCIKVLNRERSTENEAEGGSNAGSVEAIVVGVGTTTPLLLTLGSFSFTSLVLIRLINALWAVRT